MDLDRLFWLNKAIALDKERLDECVAGNLPGVPYAGDIAIADQRRLLENRIAEATEEYIRLTHFIDNIDDPYIKQVFIMRFVENQSYKDISLRFGIAAHCIAKDVYRYRQKHNLLEAPTVLDESELQDAEALKRYIDARIIDPALNLIFTIRFVDRMTWDVVAKSAGVSKTTAKERVYSNVKKYGMADLAQIRIHRWSHKEKTE